MDPIEAAISPDALNHLESITRYGLDEEALVLYGRWWQFESWLRQLAYVELKARYGNNWTEKVSEASRAQRNLEKDAKWTHMSGRDNDNPLAYVDFPELSGLIEREWPLFEPSMPPLETWQSHARELNLVRRRIAHLRLAHKDDLSRLEQALRDMELGAFTALASYNDRRRPDPEIHVDPVTNGWINRGHSAAQRLIDHAAEQYEVEMSLTFSLRPWAELGTRTLIRPGVLWHADFYSRRYDIDFGALWRDSYFSRAKTSMLHLEVHSPNHVTVTFSSADDPQQISDAIGGAFDAVLVSPSSVPRTLTLNLPPRWAHPLRRISFKLTAASAWTIVSGDTLPISIFGTGGGVEYFPL